MWWQSWAFKWPPFLAWTVFSHKTTRNKAQIRKLFNDLHWSLVVMFSYVLVNCLDDWQLKTKRYKLSRLCLSVYLALRDTPNKQLQRRCNDRSYLLVCWQRKQVAVLEKPSQDDQQVLRVCQSTATALSYKNLISTRWLPWMSLTKFPYYPLILSLAKYKYEMSHISTLVASSHSLRPTFPPNNYGLKSFQQVFTVTRIVSCSLQCYQISAVTISIWSDISPKWQVSLTQNINAWLLTDCEIMFPIS